MATAARLIIRSTGQPDQEVRLVGGASIGRASNNSICVQAAGVSRYHVSIEQRGQGFWLSDLGSKNGTLVNQVALTAERELKDGDNILLGGEASLIFRLDPAEQRSPPATRQREMPAGIGSGSDGAGSAGDAGSTGSTDRKKSGAFTALLTGIAIVGVVGLIILFSYLLSSRSSAGSGDNSAAADGRHSSSGGSDRPAAMRAESGRPAPAPALPNQGTVEQPDAGAAAAASNVDPDPIAVEIKHMAELLAVQISGHRSHQFDARFLEQIRRATPEYQFEFIDDARLYSRDIKAAFNDKGLEPVLGLVLAMSRTRMKKDRQGLWGLPGALVRDAGYMKTGEDESALAEPRRSSEIAATYIKQLQDQFGGRESFVYAVACYGDRIEQAGAMRQRLDSADPNWTARSDFWRMVETGVIPPEAALRVVRFFAAGIVSGNPERFGLRSSKLDALLIN